MKRNYVKILKNMTGALQDALDDILDLAGDFTKAIEVLVEEIEDMKKESEEQ